MNATYFASNRAALRAELCVLASVVMVVASCIPRPYVEGFPPGSEQVLSGTRLANAEQFLVVPCWERTRHEADSYEFGPFVSVPGENIERVHELVEERRGWRFVDPLGHEGDGSPSPCGVVIIGSNGHLAKVDYRMRRPPGGSWEGAWFNPMIGSLGPKRKVGLLKLLESAGSNSTPAGESVFLDIFGRRKASFLGDQESLNSARQFIEAIPASGDDLWHLPE